jgi:hypothetical protein
MDALVKIGLEGPAVLAISKAIVEIMEVGVDQATIQKALDTLSHIAKVEHISIDSCQFYGEKRSE